MALVAVQSLVSKSNSYDIFQRPPLPIAGVNAWHVSCMPGPDCDTDETQGKYTSTWRVGQAVTRPVILMGTTVAFTNTGLALVGHCVGRQRANHAL